MVAVRDGFTVKIAPVINDYFVSDFRYFDQQKEKAGLCFIRNYFNFMG